MHYWCSRNIHFSTTYHPSVYDVTYETLGHTQPGIVTAADKVKCIPHKKGMELEGNLLFNLSSIHP